MIAALFALAVPAAYAAETLYEYRGPFPAGQYTATQIGAFMRKDQRVPHEVRLPGSDAWVPAARVPEIATAWLNDPVSGPGAVPMPAAPAEPAAEATAEQSPFQVGAHTRGGANPGLKDDDSEAALQPVEGTESGEGRAKDGLRGLGEVWAGVGFPLGDGAGDPAPALRRLAGGAEWRGGPVVGRVYLRFDAASDAGVHLEDAWLRAGAHDGQGGFGRLGVARPAFAAMDRFEEGRRYWVPGASAELERSAGFEPDATLGLGGGYVGAHVTASIELADAADGGEAGTPADQVDFEALEARGRVVLALGGEGEAAPGQVGLSVGYRAPALGEATPRLLGALHAELNLRRVHLFVEGLGGMQGEAADQVPLVGGMATLAMDVPFSGDVVRQLSFVVGGLAWDPAISGLPEAKDVPDAEYRARAAANLAWVVGPSDLVTGVGWELTVPQDLAVPVSQALVVEAAWRY